MVRITFTVLQECAYILFNYLLTFYFPHFLLQQEPVKPLSKAFFSRVDVLQADLMCCMCISDGNGHTLGRKHFISVPVLSEYINRFVVHINFAPGVMIFCVLKIKLS